MDRKIWSIIIGAILIACFFLPYMSVAGFFKISAFDIISGGEMFGERSRNDSPDKYIMLLTPLAGVALLVAGLMDKSVNRILLGLLALIGLLYPIIRGIIDSGSADGLSQIFRFMGLGFWIGIAASIAVMVYNPKPRVA